MAAVLMCTAAHASRVEWNPPAEYDFRYPGKIEWYQVNDAEKHCRQLFDRYGVDVKTYSNQRGCAVKVNEVCKIVTRKRTYMGATKEAVFRHEQGHCNGWPADHPE